jgi:hypothetical protein
MHRGAISLFFLNKSIISNNTIVNGPLDGNYPSISIQSSNNNNIVNNILNLTATLGINVDGNTNKVSDNRIITSGTPLTLAGNGNMVSRNIGYVSENSGAATITAGQTSATVTHGLTITPTRVQLTPTADTGGKRYWISAKAANTFTITIDSPYTSDITFDWRAVVGEGN